MKNYKDYERHVAKLFRQWYPDAKRGMQSQEQTYVPDVVARDLLYYVEVKSGKVCIKVGSGSNTKCVCPWRHDCSWLMEYYEDRAYRWHQETGNGEWPVLIVWRVTKFSGAQDWVMMRDEDNKIVNLGWETFAMTVQS